MSKDPLPAQDTTEVLNRIFTGRRVGQPAMGYTPLTATVVSATSSSAVVTVDNFSTSASFTCDFEPRFGSGTSAKTPPAGTHCVVCFPPGTGGWVLAFQGWPT